MPPINVLLKPSSGMCNMRCDYCFYCDEAENRSRENYGFMTEETLRNIIRRTVTRADSTISYAFQGGEPTLRGLDFFRRVIELERQYNRNGVRIQNAIQTNGMLLDDEWCRFLADNRFLVGLSVDGTVDTHDRFRHMRSDGGPTWQRAVHAAELMDRYSVDYNILTVVNSFTAQHIEEIYSIYKEKGWHWQQYIACLDPIGSSDQQMPWSLDPETYGSFLIRLFRLWFADWKKDLDSAPNIRQFENYIGILMEIIPEACDQRGRCSVQYVCEADSSVYPCDFYMLDSYLLGNFNNDRMDEIDRKRDEIGFIKESEKLEDECRSCPYFSLCRGGCRRNRTEEVPGVLKNRFCEAYKMFFRECLDGLREVAGTAISG